jgi:hypothetical protein
VARAASPARWIGRRSHCSSEGRHAGRRRCPRDHSRFHGDARVCRQGKRCGRGEPPED